VRGLVVGVPPVRQPSPTKISVPPSRTIADQIHRCIQVEGSCKSIVAQRAKQAGMRWTIAGLSPIITLRALHRTTNRDTLIWGKNPSQTPKQPDHNHDAHPLGYPCDCLTFREACQPKGVLACHSPVSRIEAVLLDQQRHQCFTLSYRVSAVTWIAPRTRDGWGMW